MELFIYGLFNDRLWLKTQSMKCQNNSSNATGEDFEGSYSVPISDTIQEFATRH
jgi:hypothetical protein